MKRKQRIIFQNGKLIKTRRSYYQFKKAFPNRYYDRSNKVYIIPFIPVNESLLIVRRKKRKFQEPKKEIQQAIIQEKRFRKQIVLNLRSNSEPYAVSLRAITINPQIDRNGLILAIKEIIKSLNWDLNEFHQRRMSPSVGIEIEEIAPREDLRLNDFRVHIEVLVKRNKPINFII